MVSTGWAGEVVSTTLPAAQFSTASPDSARQRRASSRPRPRAWAKTPRVEPAAKAWPRTLEVSLLPEEERQQKQSHLEVEEFQPVSCLLRREPRADRHRPEHFALQHETVAIALDGVDLHQFRVVLTVDLHHDRVVLSKSSFRSSNMRNAVARPAPNTPPPGC